MQTTEALKLTAVASVVNGTYYIEKTPKRVIQILEEERLANPRRRLLLTYGDQETGRNWLESNDITGYIGRSTGEEKVPLLIPTKRSHGGGAILTQCIVQIRVSEGKHILYRHPTYNCPEAVIRYNESIDTPYEIFIKKENVEFEVFAQFGTLLQAGKFAQKIGLDRCPFLKFT